MQIRRQIPPRIFVFFCGNGALTTPSKSTPVAMWPRETRTSPSIRWMPQRFSAVATAGVQMCSRAFFGAVAPWAFEALEHNSRPTREPREVAVRLREALPSQPPPALTSCVSDPNAFSTTR